MALLVGVGFFTFFLIQSEMADTILLIAGATTELRPVPASATPETPEQLAQAVGFMTWPD